MQSLILVGGLGTRLKGVIPDRPKPMAPVGGKPFLEYLVIFLREQGIKDIVLSTGHLAEHIVKHFGNGEKFRVSISYSHERHLLGTGGAIRNAKSVIRSDPFFVLNGDSFLDADLTKLVDFHTQKSALCTVALKELNDSSRYGSIVLGNSNRIVGFNEKGKDHSADYINAGIYVIAKELVDIIPTSKSAVSLEREIFPRLIGRSFYGFIFKGYFIDIGVPEDYNLVQKNPKRLRYSMRSI